MPDPVKKKYDRQVREVVRPRQASAEYSLLSARPEISTTPVIGALSRPALVERTYVRGAFTAGICDASSSRYRSGGVGFCGGSL